MGRELKDRKEACVFGDLEGEWLRLREQQEQRPWGGAEPQVPGTEAARVAGVYDEGDEWQAGQSRQQALGSCPVHLHMSKNVYRSGKETLDGGDSPPAVSSRRFGSPAPETALVTMGWEYLLN